MPATARLVRRLPPLHHLQAFESVARHRSLAKAAGELRASASAVEQSIQSLEERLGLKLVRSLTPSVALTEAGQRYLQAVQGFSHRLRDELHARIPAGRTQLRVTASQAMARLWLAPRIGDFARRNPRIDLVITSTQQIEAVQGGGVDVGLRYGGPDGIGLVVLPLWVDRHVAAGAPALARQTEGMSPAEVAASLPLIDHPVTSWRQWLGAVDPGMPATSPYLRCTDLHLAIEAAVQGMGVVIAPARMLAGKFAAGQLRQVTSHSSAGQTYQAVVSPEQASRPPVKAFFAWLAEQAAGHPDDTGRRAGRRDEANADGAGAS